MVSLVAFSTRLPSIEVSDLREKLNHVFNRTFADRPENRDAVVEVDDSSIAIRVDGLKFGVSLARMRYLEDPPDEKVREQSVELYNALRDHRCFIAVDTYEKSVANEPQTYQVIGKILAEYIDANVLGIYSTQFDRLATITDHSIKLLNSPAPWRAAGLQIRPSTLARRNHPMLVQAYAEAKDRWPELLEAWKTRPAESQPMVKGRFGEAASDQQMWVRVESIGPDWVGGQLDNSAAGSLRLKRGDRVLLDMVNVTDWAYLRPGEPPAGGFTDAALHQMDEILP